MTIQESRARHDWLFNSPLALRSSAERCEETATTGATSRVNRSSAERCEETATTGATSRVNRSSAERCEE